jgi:acyl carrier protein
MTRQEIFDKLKEIMLEADDRNEEIVRKSTEETDLMQDFGFSSVNMLYIVIMIEESFGIRFENVGVQDMRKVGDVINYIAEELEK